MRKPENQNTHPLAQLTAIGRGMVDAIVMHTGIAAAGVVAGGLQGILGDVPVQLSKALQSFSFVVIGSTIGIAAILYYVLPFLPLDLRHRHSNHWS